MIDALDEALRQLLIREMPIRNGEVDVTFDQPKREWSARINRPTLNLFLHDLRENNKLRPAHPAWQFERNKNGTVTQTRRPVRLDLHYLITAWANDPEDEHRLLSRALMALLREATVSNDLLPEILQAQPVPVPINVALDEELRTPADIWSALDNELRPVITCIVTLALNPYTPITGPLVRTRELRFGEPAGAALLSQLTAAGGPDIFWSIGGTLHTEAPIEDLALILVEQGLEVPIQPEKRFVIGRLRAGEYTLAVSVNGEAPSRHKITVPAADYDIEIK
jgi:hypothetical protein